MLTNFYRTSPFTELLPRANTFLSNPIAFVSQYLEVYKLHTAHVSAETAERRRKKLEDVEKRRAYRKAHGLEIDRGWPFYGGESAPDVSSKAKKSESSTEGGVAGEPAATAGGASHETAFADFEGRRRPVKKWLGIW